jgi:hypothetical protein
MPGFGAPPERLVCCGGVRLDRVSTLNPAGDATDNALDLAEAATALVTPTTASDSAIAS